MTRLERFARNLLLHATRVRPACGCHAFAICYACPRWKTEAQQRYHEEGAAGLHPLPEHAPGWRHLYHAESWEIRRRWMAHPGGFAGHANDLLRRIRSYERWQLRLLFAAALLAGFGLGSGSAIVVAASIVLGLWAFRDWLSGLPRRLGRLLRKAWASAADPDPPALPY